MAVAGGRVLDEAGRAGRQATGSGRGCGGGCVHRVRIGTETRDVNAVRTARLLGGDRLVVVDRLPAWFAPASDRAGAGLVRLDARAGAIADATVEVAAARASGVAEVVVRLIDDPGTDEALAAYAALGELVEGSPTTQI